MMKRRTSAIVLLMLSLVVLVAAADGVDQAIRLPSGDAMAAASHGGQERPWKCCDRPLCTKSFPPICRCLDTVKQCAGACKHCETSSSRHVCMDSYMGWPGRTCSKPKPNPKEGDADVVQVMAEAAAETAAEEEVVEERPWECCDRPLCTRSIPPRCRCRDTVEQCAGACKRCETASSSPSRHVCMDVYKGWPGPTCTKPKEGDADVVQVMAEAAAEEVKEERPWACCTKTVCTRSIPPRCRCMDRVYECHPACQACRQVSMGPDRYVCQDSYQGPPGPTC